MYLKLKEGYTFKVLEYNNYITVDDIKMFLGRIKRKVEKQTRRNYGRLNGYDVYGRNNCDIVYLKVKKQVPKHPPPPPPPPPPPEPTPIIITKSRQSLDNILAVISNFRPTIKDNRTQNDYKDQILKNIYKLSILDLNKLKSEIEQQKHDTTWKRGFYTLIKDDKRPIGYIKITSTDDILKQLSEFNTKAGGYRATRKRSKLTQRRRRYSRRHATS